MFHGKFKVTDNMGPMEYYYYFGKFCWIVQSRECILEHGAWSQVIIMYYLMGIQNKVIIMVEYISAKCQKKK